MEKYPEDVAENEKSSWVDYQWPGYPLNGTIGPEEPLVIPDNYKSANKPQYLLTPKQLAAEHLNSVTIKANKKLRRTKKYGNYNTRRSKDNP